MRRDANEQMVAAHVYNRLSNFVSDLTVHVFKDDWTRPVSYQVLSENSFAGRPNFGSPLVSTLPVTSTASSIAATKSQSAAVNVAKAAGNYFPLAPIASANHFQQNGTPNSPHTINSQHLNSDILNLLGSNGTGSDRARIVSYTQSSLPQDRDSSRFPGTRTDPDGATKIL